MAERRMFAKTIIDSDAFLDMPISSQNLYFHLAMRADDDGFLNNAKKIQRMVNAGDDDLRVLVAKSFIIPFETGVIVIKHWRVSNYLRSDRHKPTVYQEEFKRLFIKENGSYTLSADSGIPIGNHCETQVRLELGKDRVEEEEAPSPVSRIESARTAWNGTPGLPQYRYMAMNIPPDKASPMLRTLSAYSDDDVSQSIKNYAKILSDPGYEVFPRYGSFQGFMSGGVELFHDDAKPFDRCRKKPEKQGYQKMGALDDRPDAWTADDIRKMQEDTDRDREPVDLLGYIADSPLAAAMRGKQEADK